ncbi:MAG: hypothetical protein IT352_15780 [Gemmatimonadales bacterium]|nr:hypothetical protein [Gemmatimonadales bacterium]
MFDLDHPLRYRRACSDAWSCYLDLWSLATFRDHVRVDQRRDIVVKLAVGEVLVAYSYLATRWHVTEKVVRSKLKLFEKLGFLVRGKGTPQGTIYRLTGYEDAQPGGTKKGTTKGKLGAGSGQARGRAGAGSGQEENQGEPGSDPGYTPHQPGGTLGPPGVGNEFFEELAGIWADAHGVVPSAELRASLEPALAHHTPADIRAAARAFLSPALNDDKPQFLTPRALAGHLRHWIEQADLLNSNGRPRPLQVYDANGEPTPEAIRALGLTR